MTANVGTVQVRLCAVLYLTLVDEVILVWGGVGRSGVGCIVERIVIF
jgi:hypothetical protein